MDVKEWLKENDIEFFTRGNNVGVGWINITCPFCGDDSNHLGIRLKNLQVSCWRCGRHKFVKLVIELIDCSYQDAKQIEQDLSLEADKDYSPFSKKDVDNASSILTLKKTILPPESTKTFPIRHTKYLRSRGFNPTKKFIRKYKLLAVHNIGKYKFRIIIPVYLRHHLVAFTSRDITDIQSPKYLSSGKYETTINIKETIYNYDSVPVGGDAILVEGPLDAWKLGDGAISLLSANCIDRQIVLLKEKKIRNLFILFDNDKPGNRASKSIARVLAPLVKRIEIVRFNGHVSDPGSLSLDQAEVIKSQLGFRLKE